VTGFGDATRLMVAVGAEAVTVTELAADVLVRKFEFPIYRAVRLYVPAGRDAMDSVAMPEEFTLADPSTVEPFMKLTVPDSDAVPLALTVATRFRVCPTVTGFGDATRLVIVVAVEAVTVTEAAADVLVRKFEFPIYRAVRLYVPAGRDAVDSVATPEEFTLPDPNTVEPFMKLTVPDSDAVPLTLTVATRFRVCPTVTGFGDATKLVIVAAVEAVTVTDAAADVLVR